jgi:hypothetical protein
MASYTNRSRYVVAFTKHPELTREFPFTEHREARAYLKHLRGNHKDCSPKDPALTQREDSILIRFRDLGFPEFTLGATSYEEAAKIVQQVEADPTPGILIDYSSSLKISLAKIIDAYLEEKCPKHKGSSNERYTLSSMLADAGYETKFARERRLIREEKIASRPKKTEKARGSGRAHTSRTS